MERREGGLAMWPCWIAKDKDKHWERIPRQRAGKTQRIIAFIAPRQSICIHQKLLPLASYCGALRKNCHPKIRLRHCLWAECWLCNCIHNYTIDHGMMESSNSCHLGSEKSAKKNKQTKTHEGDNRGSVKLGLVWTGSGGGIPFVYPTQGPPKRLVVKTVKMGSKVKCKFTTI